LTPLQKAAAWDVLLHRKDDREFLTCFDQDFRSSPAETIRLLEAASGECDAEAVEILLGLGALSPEAVPVLCHLLLAGFHTRHEDMAFLLQKLKDPRSTEALYQACFLQLPYRDYDELDILARKCTWALHDVGTEAALEKLRLLADDLRPAVSAYAKKRLPG
jgi:hypothetical protein